MTVGYRRITIAIRDTSADSRFVDDKPARYQQVRRCVGVASRSRGQSENVRNTARTAAVSSVRRLSATHIYLSDPGKMFPQGFSLKIPLLLPPLCRQRYHSASPHQYARRTSRGSAASVLARCATDRRFPVSSARSACISERVRRSGDA